MPLVTNVHTPACICFFAVQNASLNAVKSQSFCQEVYPLTHCYIYRRLNITDIYQLSCSYQGIAPITGQD